MVQLLRTGKMVLRKKGKRQQMSECIICKGNAQLCNLGFSIVDANDEQIMDENGMCEVYIVFSIAKKQHIQKGNNGK